MHNTLGHAEGGVKGQKPSTNSHDSTRLLSLPYIIVGSPIYDYLLKCYRIPPLSLM